MCGIAGIFLKDCALEPEVGILLAGMLGTLCDRGPDSAGFAVYGEALPDHSKLTLRAPKDFDFGPLSGAIKSAVAAYEIHDTHMVIAVPRERERAVFDAIAKEPEVEIVATGRRMALFKEVGRPDKVAARFGLDRMSGTHAIGHTRMATESAVTTKGAHPFTTGPDQCLVHNGSLSNHNALRRELIRNDLTFETDNDSEVAAGFLTWRMREGASARTGDGGIFGRARRLLHFCHRDRGGFGVLRDPIACKPAVMAETDRWVAFGTEYRALVGLPGIDVAKVWEPEPARPYLWERH